MAMAWVWCGILVVSVLAGALGGRMDAVSAAVLSGAERGAALCVTLAGPMCLWMGLSEVMTRSGLAQKLAACLRPFLGKLFPQASRDEAAMRHLSGNFTANLLGLGNAATPLGIAAVRRMQQLSGAGDTASDEMCRLIVMNTASVQLIPATVAALRAANGAASPFSILPAVWITSVCSVSAGLLAAKLFSLWRR